MVIIRSSSLSLLLLLCTLSDPGAVSPRAIRRTWTTTGIQPKDPDYSHTAKCSTETPASHAHPRHDRVTVTCRHPVLDRDVGFRVKRSILLFLRRGTCGFTVKIKGSARQGEVCCSLTENGVRNGNRSRRKLLLDLVFVRKWYARLPFFLWVRIRKQLCFAILGVRG